MRIFLMFLLLLPFRYTFGQSLTLLHVDTIVSKQNQKSGLSGDSYRFIKGKIAFASIYGNNTSDGKFHLKGEIFKNVDTKEILWIEVQESNARKKMISCSMGYTALAPVISKMEESLPLNGYKYRKKKQYYIKRNNRKEYIIVRMRKHSSYVSEFDNQPEILFTATKQLK